MNDAQLVEAVLRGDVQAQRSLYERFARKMFGVCLRYSGSREEAEDFLQEGFIRVFQKISSFKGGGVLEAWIRKVMVNTALEQLRKQKIEWAEANQLPEEGHEPEIISKMETGVLLEAIGKMPYGYKIIFNLFAIEGYGHGEIASMLNISEGTSKSQYARARAQLVKTLTLLNSENKTPA